MIILLLFIRNFYHRLIVTNLCWRTYETHGIVLMFFYFFSLTF